MFLQIFIIIFYIHVNTLLFIIHILKYLYTLNPDELLLLVVNWNPSSIHKCIFLIEDV